MASPGCPANPSHGASPKTFFFLRTPELFTIDHTYNQGMRGSDVVVFLTTGQSSMPGSLVSVDCFTLMPHSVFWSSDVF